VFAKPRKLETESELYEAALRALSRRAHSIHDMKQNLARRADNRLLVQVVLARLRESGLLDDARYAKQFTRYRAESRRQGKFRIARDLRARGVPDRHINAALDERAAEADDSAVVRQRIERKLRSYGGPHAIGKAGDRRIASIYRSLLRAGFPADLVRRELRSITREDVPETGEHDV